ncbi:MAG TPA: hypothetical protein VFQ80_05435 [Thermomicrobiales bacterium]|jgi:hypothetical protein|nr:hypothetical protein [Thermomicrobiales bacterium]
MEANRESQPRSENRDPDDDAWTPADPDPRDAFDETLPADRSEWEAAVERERRAARANDE